MALRDRRTNISFDLWCLVASGGLDICVSSTSFQKSNIGWPQQPLTERASNSNEKLDFWWSIPKKWLVLVIWVLGMIQPSGWIKLLMKWVCWGHWGHRYSKAWKITTEHSRVIQVVEFSFILMFWKPLFFVKSWNIIFHFLHFFCWRLMRPA